MANVDGTDEPHTMGRGILVGAAITVCTLIMLGSRSRLHPGGTGNVWSLA